jgi:hypothetical protein
MTHAPKARRAAPLICAAAIVAASGCTEAPAPPGTAEPGSKAAASPPPKDVPKGVKTGKGKAELQ